MRHVAQQPRFSLSRGVLPSSQGQLIPILKLPVKRREQLTAGTIDNQGQYMVSSTLALLFFFFLQIFQL